MIQAKDGKNPTKWTTLAKGCEAGYNCWLIDGVEYCAICKRGNYDAWRERCDLGRKAMGMPSYAELIEMAGKAFKGEAK